MWHCTSSGLGASRAWVVLKMPTIYLVSSLAWRVYSANDRIQWAGILAIVPRKDTVPTLGLRSLSQLSGSDGQAPHSQSGVERFLFPGRVPQNPKTNLISWDSYKKKEKNPTHLSRMFIPGQEAESKGSGTSRSPLKLLFLNLRNGYIKHPSLCCCYRLLWRGVNGGRVVQAPFFVCSPGWSWN